MKDRTLYAVQRQIKAMGADKYEFGIRSQETGKMMLREWQQDEINKDKVNWLKRRNAKNEDIYIRPQRQNLGQILLIDDVEGVDIENMVEDGIQPAVICETSHKNLQVWIKLNRDADYRTRTEIARFLAEDYQGDKNSADAYHFGRLAGFTNKKPEYIGPKGFPFVLLRNSKGLECGCTQTLIDRANKRWEARNSLDMPRFIQNQSLRNEGVTDYSELYNNIRKAYLEEVGLDDLSRVDWAFGNILFRRWKDREKTAQAIASTSPELENRKKGHENEYLLRTTIKLELFQTQFPDSHYMEVQQDLSRMTAEKMQELKGGRYEASI